MWNTQQRHSKIQWFQNSRHHRCTNRALPKRFRHDPAPVKVLPTGFSYARTTKINNVKFTHQSVCNPPISSLMKAINAGFMKGAPHLDTQMGQKYLLASPAMAKGHMKRRSTTPKQAKNAPNIHILPTPQRVTDVTMPGLENNDEEEMWYRYRRYTTSSMRLRMNPLPTKYEALYTTIAREISRTCHSMGTSVFS